jgi:integrase
MACIRQRRGKFVVDYRDATGRRRWVSFEDRDQAIAYQAKILPETVRRPKAAVALGINVADYSDHWMSLIQALKPRTLTSYRYMLDRHILPTFGAVKVRDLTRGDIKQLLAKKLAPVVSSDGKQKPGLSRNTVRIVHATIRAMLRAAVDDGLINANPADKLGRSLHLATPKATRQEDIKAMTATERHRFLEQAAKTDPRYYHLFFTLAGTGARIGEALALQWQDIDMQRREIRIDRALSAGEASTPKSGHGRTVDMSQALALALSQFDFQRRKAALTRPPADGPAWVFCTREGTPLDYNQVRKAMLRVLKAAKLPLHFTPHSFRHTYASLMLQNGESPAYVQRQLGHASYQLTVDTYGKWLPMGNKAAVDRLDGVAGQNVVAAVAGNRGVPSQPLDFGGPTRTRTWDQLIMSQPL